MMLNVILSNGNRLNQKGFSGTRKWLRSFLGKISAVIAGLILVLSLIINLDKVSNITEKFDLSASQSDLDNATQLYHEVSESISRRYTKMNHLFLGYEANISDTDDRMEEYRKELLNWNSKKDIYVIGLNQFFGVKYSSNLFEIPSIFRVTGLLLETYYNDQHEGNIDNEQEIFSDIRSMLDELDIKKNSFSFSLIHVLSQKKIASNKEKQEKKYS